MAHVKGFSYKKHGKVIMSKVTIVPILSVTIEGNSLVRHD